MRSGDIFQKSIDDFYVSVRTLNTEQYTEALASLTKDFNGENHFAKTSKFNINWKYFLPGKILGRLDGRLHPLHGEEGGEVGGVGADHDEGEEPPEGCDHSCGECSEVINNSQMLKGLKFGASLVWELLFL